MPCGGAVLVAVLVLWCSCGVAVVVLWCGCGVAVLVQCRV